jgi:hypothetical protein
MRTEDRMVEEEDLKVEDAEDVKDEAGPALFPPTPPTPGAEEGSQGTNANVDESNTHLSPEDQPHPARKHSDADVVGHFCMWFLPRFVHCVV